MNQETIDKLTKALENARYSEKAKYGELIEAVANAFSGYADTMGEYILSQALEKVTERMPEREKESAEMLKRLQENSEV